MSLYWLYDLPNWAFCLTVICTFVVISTAALLMTRGSMRRLLGKTENPNELVSYYLSAVGVFYGLTVGLIAVATWEQFKEVDDEVSNEASAVAACYMDVSRMPEPHKTELQQLLAEYTRYTIEDAWPVQQRGTIPKGGSERVTAFYDRLLQYEPESDSQRILLAEAVGKLNEIIETRRKRLQRVPAGLPATIWWVVILGAGMNLAIMMFFITENLKLHLWLTGLLAALIGLLVFLIAAMDNPFRGEFSVSPEAFQVIYERLMVGPSAAKN
jgi:hypothetical protein